jgi:hypothetical protein
MGSPWTVRLLIPLTWGVLALAGCRFMDSTEPTVEEGAGAPVGTQALTTEGGSRVLSNGALGISITLPNSWRADNRLNNQAALQASDPENDLYLVVVHEENNALQRLGLRENAAAYRNLLIRRLQGLDGETPTDVAFVNGTAHYANQAEIRGRVANDTPVVYLHTTVIVDRSYYQIVAWTTPEQYSTYKSELQTIIDSFQAETAGSGR